MTDSVANALILQMQVSTLALQQGVAWLLIAAGVVVGFLFMDSLT